MIKQHTRQGIGEGNYMERNSIRGRLIISLILGLGTLLSLFGLILNSYLKGRFLERFDADVLGRAQMLITLTGIVEGEVELEFADEFMPEFSQPEGPEFFQLWLPDGSLLERSESLVDRDLPRLAGVLQKPEFRDLELEPGGRCRLVQMSFIPEDETRDIEGEMELEGHEPHAMTICLAKNRESYDRFLQRTQHAILGSFLLLMLLIISFVIKALGHGLRPLNDMRNQVARLDPHHLDTPIRLDVETLELMPVVTQLNAMLARLRAAMERERQFTSNVAHELRTPIAELRSLSDVGVKLLDNREATFRFFGDVKEIAVEMEQIVVNLLSLSRCDSGTQMVATERLNLCALIRKAWKRASAEARQRGLTAVLDVPRELWLDSDPIMVEQILQNLLNNAAAHAPLESTIAIRIAPATSGSLIQIKNPTRNLVREDIQHIFDRFWQKDDARTGGKHAGLGLSLVSSFSKLLGFSVRADLDGENQFVITLSIPKKAVVPEAPRLVS